MLDFQISSYLVSTSWRFPLLHDKAGISDAIVLNFEAAGGFYATAGIHRSTGVKPDMVDYVI